MNRILSLKHLPPKWVTTTLLISIFPVILFGTAIYYMGSWIVQEEIYRSSRESLSQIEQQVETRLANIEQMTSQISMQSNTIDVMNIADEPPLGAALESNRVRNDLAMMKSGTDGLLSVYFYHFNQKTVITNELITLIHEDRVFQDTGWLGDVDRMIQTKSQRKWITPRLVTAANGQKETVITHIRLLPMLYNEAKAAVVVNLKPDFLTQVISKFPLGSEGQVMVINKEGQVIAQTMAGAYPGLALDQVQAFMEDHSQERTMYTGRAAGYYLSMVKSSWNDWTYAMIIPSSTPRHQVELFKQTIIAISLLLCILAIFSAYFSHKQIKIVIKRIMEKLSINRHPDDDSGNDEWLRIERHINGLLEEVHNGKSLQEKHFPLLHTHYLHSAIHGNVVDLTRLSEELQEWELFPWSHFSVMVIQMDAESSSTFDKDQALFLFAVSNIAHELTALHFIGGNVRLDSILVHPYAVIILNYNGETVSEAGLVEYADELRRVVKKILKHTVTIGVGRSVRPVHNLAYSYREALQALQMNWANVYDEVLPYQNMTLVAGKLAQYPSVEEQDILRALRARDGRAALHALAEFRIKLEQDHPSFHLIKTFYLQLLVAMIRLLQEYDDDTERMLQGNNPYEAFFSLNASAAIHAWFAEDLLVSILAFMESVKRNKTEILIKKTLVWIQDRYTTDLSLQSAADEAGISASYLSQLFKDEVGESFVEYVTALRLEHAVRLLTATDYNLQQISEQIGYTSVQQLFRVFKKKYGITPGEYREKQARHE